MNESRTIGTTRSISIINLLLGAWLMASPYILGYTSSQSKWYQVTFGAVIVIFAVWRLFDVAATWASWVNVLAAAVLIIVPFAAGYSTAAAWNEIVTAIIVLLLAWSNSRIHTGQIHHSAI